MALVRVPRRDPLPYVGNINKMELPSQLEFETVSMGRQPSYAGESQLRGEDKANTLFPRERLCSEELCRPHINRDPDPGRPGEMSQCSEGEAGARKFS